MGMSSWGRQFKKMRSFRKLFVNAISSMVFACGGEENPSRTLIDLIGKLTLIFIQKLLVYCVKLSSTNQLDWKNMLIVLQKDYYSFIRAKELIELKEDVTTAIQVKEAGEQKLNLKQSS